MSECDRCDGTGEIDGDIETVDCPNCRDVCQWCNQQYDDGEPLGDTGLAVCRPCIRDMAAYKERTSCQLAVSVGYENYLSNADELRSDLDDAVLGVFANYGVQTDSGDWDVRLPEDTEA